MELVKIEWDPTGHTKNATCPGCGAAWYRVLHNGKLVAFQCGNGHKPIEFLTKAQMRFR